MRLAFLSTPLVLLFAGCLGNDAASSTDTASADAPTVIEVETAEALVDDVTALGAPTVVLNFWATWCGPCVAEFPVFVAFARDHDDAEVQVRFVSLDAPRDLDAVKTFLAEQQVPDPSYLYTGAGDLTTQLNPLFGGGAIPVTMVLNGEGIVEYTHVGALTRSELDGVMAQVREGRS